LKIYSVEVCVDKYKSHGYYTQKYGMIDLPRREVKSRECISENINRDKILNVKFNLKCIWEHMNSNKAKQINSHINIRVK